MSLIKEGENKMRTIKVLENTSSETKREFYVPVITDTTPVRPENRPEKEIDLYFWQMIERNRRATEYSQNVAKHKVRPVSRLKLILSGLLAGTCMICFSIGFFWIGLISNF